MPTWMTTSSAPSSPITLSSSQRGAKTAGASYFQFANQPLAAVSTPSATTPVDISGQHKQQYEPVLLHNPNASWPGVVQHASGSNDTSLQHPTPIGPFDLASFNAGASSDNGASLAAATDPNTATAATTNKPLLPPSMLMQRHLSPSNQSGLATATPATQPRAQATRQRSASQPQGRNRALSTSDDGSAAAKKRMQSCDICRIRKVKCVRPDDTASILTGKCKQCLANDAKCTYAYVPKKPGPQTSSAKALARREDKERQLHASAAAMALTKGALSGNSASGSGSGSGSSLKLKSAQRRGSDHYTATTSSGGDGGEHSSSSSRKSSIMEHISPSAMQQQHHQQQHQQQYNPWEYFADPYAGQPASAPPTQTGLSFNHAASSAHLPLMAPQWTVHDYAHDAHAAATLAAQLQGNSLGGATMDPLSPLELGLLPPHHPNAFPSSLPLMGGHDAVTGLPLTRQPSTFQSTLHQQQQQQQHAAHLYQQQQQQQQHMQPSFAPYGSSSSSSSTDVSGNALFGAQRAACLHASPSHSSVPSRPSSMLYGEHNDGTGGAATGMPTAASGSFLGPYAHRNSGQWATPALHDANNNNNATSIRSHDEQQIMLQQQQQQQQQQASLEHDAHPPPPMGTNDDHWNDLWHFASTSSSSPHHG